MSHRARSVRKGTAMEGRPDLRQEWIVGHAQASALPVNYRKKEVRSSLGVTLECDEAPGLDSLPFSRAEFGTMMKRGEVWRTISS